jgi:hypothetical protein
MKKSYIAMAIVVLLITITTAFFWSYEQPKSPINVYYKGEKVGNTGFYFDGFTYIEPPLDTPPMGASPLPTSTSHLALCVVFKPTTTIGAGGESEPTEFEIELNLNGNTNTQLGNRLDNEFYTIVSYNIADQTISMIYG